MDEDEEIETLWVDIRKAAVMVNDGTIEDAKTIIAIQYANLYLVWGKGAKQKNSLWRFCLPKDWSIEFYFR